jgi:7-cyano-7-deazaguanine synthase
MSGRLRKAVVLLSGGLDSATTLAIAQQSGFEAHALTLLYGQRHAVESERATTIAAAAGAYEHRIARIDLSFVSGSALTDDRVAVPKSRSDAQISQAIPPTYVPGRNTIFLSLALAWAEALEARDIFIGVNAVDYSGYPDCRPEFIASFERLAKLATKAGAEGERFTLHAPLLGMTKAEIIGKAVELGVELALTLSCYDPDPAGRPCESCDSCLLRARGFREAGLADPALDRDHDR